MVLQVKDQLLGRLANLIGMARKSSSIVSGSNAVLEALNGKKKLTVVVMAQDISDQIAAKVHYKAEQNQVVTTSLFDKEKLGHILGRAERSVLGLHEGQLAEAFIQELQRYQEISGEV
jgi:ribosomal protein L7Ae-like RNA K-turn-binding protein